MNRATRTDDSLIALASASDAAVPPLVLRAIDARWTEYVPWMELEARKLVHPASGIAERIGRLRSLHRARCLALVRAGITWRTIRRMRLDDPLWDAEFFSDALVCATRRKIGKRIRTIRKGE